MRNQAFCILHLKMHHIVTFHSISRYQKDASVCIYWRGNIISMFQIRSSAPFAWIIEIKSFVYIGKTFWNLVKPFMMPCDPEKIRLIVLNWFTQLWFILVTVALTCSTRYYRWFRLMGGDGFPWSSLALNCSSHLYQNTINLMHIF